MKHFIVSIIIFTCICISSIFTDLYLYNFFTTLENELNILNTATEIADTEKQTIRDISNKFMQNKNMLLFITNKEHISNIQTKLELIDNSIKNDNLDNLNDYSTELIGIISENDISIFSII